MEVLWIDLGLMLSELLADYPSHIARDSIAAALRQVNVSLLVVTPEEAVIAAQSEPRVFLFSATTPEWPRVVSVASQVRAASPQSVLVVGGHHASAMPNGPGTEFFDYVVVGEGEEVLRNIIIGFAARGSPSRDIPRLQVLRGDRIRSLERLPTPLRNIAAVSKCRLRGLMFPSPSEQTGAAALLLSRGCNNSCTFCASHIVWGSQLITRSSKSAALEVKSVVDDLECNAMVFVDQAFGEQPKWTREICLRLRSFGIPQRARWYCMAKTSLNLTLLGDMASAGCSKIGFGVETADHEMRKSLKCGELGSIEKFNRLFQVCNKLGILVKVYFIIGFPWETHDYFMETARAFIEKLEANELKISFFTPFPGSADWVRYKNQLITSDWADFDTIRMPVVYNPRISVTQYNEIRSALFKSFYGSPTYADVTRQMIGAYPHYVESYREFADYLDHFEMISGNEAWLEWVRHGQASRFAMAGGH